jgi:TrmH RNA methyltransferase
MKNHHTAKEVKYYGIHACLSIAKHRPQDVIRVYLHSSNLKTFRPLLKWCAENKKAYHMVSNEELDKISSSVHHEGVCLLAKERPNLSVKEFMNQLKEIKGDICLLYLDGVQNPHNIGSILRTSAHFGIPFILGSKGSLPSLSPSACRIAKGGAEIVKLVEIEDVKAFVMNMKKQGFSLLSTSSHVSESLYSFSLPNKMILAMGSEAEGVGKQLQSLSDMLLQIPGTGDVESLNVSVATSLFLGEFYRQRRGV